MENNNYQRDHFNEYPPQNYYREPKLPEKYEPITAWGYIGYKILFWIPIIGLISLLIFALVGKNINVKNFARSYFCALILEIIVILLVFLIAGNFIMTLIASLGLEV